MKIAILNYADVRNFGDVLFPLIVAHELSKRLPDAQIDYVTPTGSSWAGMTSIRLDAAELASYDALILGGGEIVHRADAMLSGIYSSFHLPSIERPTDLVFGWASAPVPFKAWIGLGVPEPSADVVPDIRVAMSALDFVGVRGARSAERLRRAAPDVEAQVRQTPDIGWLFPRLLEGRNPLNAAIGSPYVAVQALGFIDVSSTAAALQRIARKTGLRIVLLPLTRCWQDVNPLRELRDAGNGAFFLVNDYVPDLDKLGILGAATLYIGQSMHGFIGAMSQCRPAGLCMRGADDKFKELLLDTEMQHLRVDSWDHVEELAERLVALPLDVICRTRARIEAELDRLFDDVCDQMVELSARGARKRASADEVLLF